MTDTTAVWERISHPEDGLTERKPEGAGTRDFKETLVAFANSVEKGSEGVLFIGIEDRTGKIIGCENVDSLQKTITRICKKDCYPPITHRLESRDFEGKKVLAAIVPYSAQRPHFSGHAFRRIGSQNVKADEDAYSDFILARNSVGAKILEHRGQIVPVRTQGKKLGDPTPLAPSYQDSGLYEIGACDSHAVTLRSVQSDQWLVEPLENFTVSYVVPSGLLQLVVREARR